jgi:predicted 3-demethylubiquinone-9 3-methyltransferase (glyoxalase superfamily)
MQRMAPCLMFVGDQCGKAKEAIDLYLSAFADSAVLEVERLGSEDGGDRGIKRARFQLAGHELVAMDSPGPHHFTFTPAISLVVECDSEDELDAAWERLADGATGPHAAAGV